VSSASIAAIWSRESWKSKASKFSAMRAGLVDFGIAERPKRLADELFVREWPVRFGGIEERDPAVDGGANGRDAFLAARRLSVTEANAHAPESQR
jgi:hypothetical protein